MNQDNPFAKGVSINQDIVHEEEKEVSAIQVIGEIVAPFVKRRKDRRELLALGREEE